MTTTHKTQSAAATSLWEAYRERMRGQRLTAAPLHVSRSGDVTVGAFLIGTVRKTADGWEATR
jgi:hypothetical protein